MRLPGLPARLGFAWLAACKTLASKRRQAHRHSGSVLPLYILITRPRFHQGLAVAARRRPGLIMLRAALSRLTAAAPRPAAPATTRAFASNRSKRGIYAGKDIRFGNNISFSHRKTRRTFKPNAQRKRLWSETLGCWLRFNLTTHALRCIDRAGGIDAYLLKTPDAKLGSIAGANARRMIEAARSGGDPS